MWFTFNENTVPFMIGNLNCFIHSFPFLILSGFYGACRLDKIFTRKPRGQHKKDLKKNDDLNSEEDQDDLFVERIRLEKMDLRLCDVLLKKSLSLCLSLSSTLMNRSLRKVKLNDQYLWVYYIFSASCLFLISLLT